MVETRRSSSSSKRTLSSPSPSTSKRSKVSDDASPSTLPAPGTIAPVNESGIGNDSREPELRSADLPDTASLKPVDVCDEDKPPSEPVEGEDVVSPQYPGETATDVDKSKAAAGAAAGRSKKRVTKATKSAPKAAWGKLISQCSQNPHLSISEPIFTVGQGRHCNLWLKDPSVGNVLCKLSHIERGGSSIALLEITGGKGSVQVNGKTHRKNVRLILSGGDEVVFGSSSKHAYIFQQLTNNSLTTGIPSSMSILEVQSAPMNGIQVEATSGDSSAVARASKLASLSNLHKDLSLLPPTAKTGKNVQQNTDISSPPSGHGDDTPDNEMKPSPNNDEPSGGVYADKTVLASSIAGNENPSIDTMEVDADVDADVGKITASFELRPLLRLLEGSCPELDLSGNISKILEERRELRELLKDVDTLTLLASTKHQAFKESLQQRIINADNIDVSFEDFPYYLSDTTKNVLTSSTYIHLKCDGFGKYASDLPSVSPRILLSGPTGSEIYQETLCKALAKHFGAKILIVDSLSLPGGAPSKEVDSAKETSKSERLSVFSKRSTQATTSQQKKPASSVDAEIIGGSTLSSQATLKQEVSTASSKGTILKTGDRVKFVGNFPSAVSSLQSSRGPSYGSRGKVLLAFEDNGSSKIGVRFDKPIPDGNDLGGLCEVDHGFFCSANHLLRVDGTGGDDIDKLAINDIFEVVCNESKSGALVLFIKDIEKAMVGNSENLKSKFENLPQNVVVVGSHTQLDNRKEKTHPGGLLFTKFGSNQTALLDLAFPDNFSRLHDRSKETPKVMKQLNRLFPNRVTIQLPQDEALLSDWKQQLERDIGTMKAQANLVSIHSVLNRIGLNCSDLESLCIKDQTLSTESVERIIGWAISYHFMHSTESSNKDSNFVISAESIKYGLSILQGIQNENKSSKKSLKDVVTENEFEKKLLGDVIPPTDIGVTFDDIGALENVKDTLKGDKYQSSQEMEVEFGDQGEENESKEDTDSDTKDDGYIHRVVTSKNRGVVERDDDYEQVGKGRSPSGSPIDDRVQTRDLHSVPEMHDVFGDSDDEDEEVGYAVQHDIQQYSDRSPMEKEGSYGKGLKPVDLHSEEDHQYISEEENFEMKLKDKPLGPQLVLEVPLQPPPAPPENMHMIRVSNIMGVDPKPFDPKTYVEENTFLTDESGTKRRIRLENNIVRWRTVRNPDGTTSTESNARFVRWSDGSLQLLIGNEVLDTTVQDIQHDQAHLFRRHGQGILQSQGRLLRKMRFMPSSLSSNSHRQLTALVGSTQKKAYKVKSCITDIDPEREKRGNEKAFSQSIQSNVILNRKHEKVSQKYPPTVYRRRQLSPGFLDEDAETEYHKSPRSQHRFEVDLELEALAEKRIMNAKNSQGLKDIARKSSQAPANSSRHRIVYSDNDREESEYETDGEKDKRPISRKRTEDTEPEYVDDDEEEEHYEEDVQVNDASDEEKPKEKSKDIRGRFKGKGIESHEDSPRRKTSYRRKVIIYDSDEE